MVNKHTTSEKAAIRRERRTTRKRIYRKVSEGLRNHGRTLALCLIIVAAGIAVFDGALYSATVFGFSTVPYMGWIPSSATVFALMPDALMVLSAAKMRERNIHPEQWEAARKSMRFGLFFSLFTNMNAAVLHIIPSDAWWLPLYINIMTVIYHGVVVLILWYAVETVTKVRAERKGRGEKPKQDNASQAAKPVGAPRRSGRKPSVAKESAQQVPVLVPTFSANGASELR